MKSFRDHDHRNGNAASASEDLKPELDAFRDAARQAAERPVFFWTRQRASIRSRLSDTARPFWRRGLAWTAPLVVLACSLLFFVGESKAPPPDFAGGDDEVLLIEVERALNRDFPTALDPAILMIDQIDRAKRHSR